MLVRLILKGDEMALDGVIKELLLKAGGGEIYVQNNKEFCPVKAAQNFELAFTFLNQALDKYPSSAEIQSNIAAIQTGLLVAMQGENPADLEDLGSDPFFGMSL